MTRNQITFKSSPLCLAISVHPDKKFINATQVIIDQIFLRKQETVEEDRKEIQGKCLRYLWTEDKVHGSENLAPDTGSRNPLQALWEEELSNGHNWN